VLLSHDFNSLIRNVLLQLLEQRVQEELVFRVFVPMAPHFFSDDIPAKNIRSGEIFQFQIWSQQGHPSKKKSVMRDIPVQNIQAVRTSQQVIMSQ
jgi:hypothetical protein